MPGKSLPVPSDLSNRPPPPSPLSNDSAKLLFCLLWENRASGTYLLDRVYADDTAVLCAGDTIE